MYIQCIPCYFIIQQEVPLGQTYSSVPLSLLYTSIFKTASNFFIIYFKFLDSITILYFRFVFLFPFLYCLLPCSSCSWYLCINHLFSLFILLFILHVPYHLLISDFPSSLFSMIQFFFSRSFCLSLFYSFCWTCFFLFFIFFFTYVLVYKHFNLNMSLFKIDYLYLIIASSPLLLTSLIT